VISMAVEAEIREQTTREPRRSQGALQGTDPR
jgi:hypothetical protein